MIATIGGAAGTRRECGPLGPTTGQIEFCIGGKHHANAWNKAEKNGLPNGGDLFSQSAKWQFHLASDWCAWPKGWLRAPFGNVPPIAHTAAVNVESPILAAEVIAFLLQRRSYGSCLGAPVDGLCRFFDGRGGTCEGPLLPTKGGLGELEGPARMLSAALKS